MIGIADRQKPTNTSHKLAAVITADKGILFCCILASLNCYSGIMDFHLVAMKPVNDFNSACSELIEQLSIFFFTAIEFSGQKRFLRVFIGAI